VNVGVFAPDAQVFRVLAHELAGLGGGGSRGNDGECRGLGGNVEGVVGSDSEVDSGIDDHAEVAGVAAAKRARDGGGVLLEEGADLLEAFVGGKAVDLGKSGVGETGDDGLDVGNGGGHDEGGWRCGSGLRGARGPEVG
jgi:hypothetical protein